jgi:hypothetical protein
MDYTIPMISRAISSQTWSKQFQEAVEQPHRTISVDVLGDPSVTNQPLRHTFWVITGSDKRQAEEE